MALTFGAVDDAPRYFGAADTYMYGITDVYSTTCTAGGVEPSYCQDLIKEGNLQQAGCASWWLTPDNAPVNAPVTVPPPTPPTTPTSVAPTTFMPAMPAYWAPISANNAVDK